VSALIKDLGKQTKGEHAGSPLRHYCGLLLRRKGGMINTKYETDRAVLPRQTQGAEDKKKMEYENNRVMRYDPDIHHRRSIRLKGYDYSRAGAYFVTICTHHHQCLFGRIENGVMFLNDAGEMISRWWNELKNKYANIEIDDYVVMPNHFHGIIHIVGADLCVCPDNNSERIKGEHAGSPLQRTPIYKMAQWFKTMTTNKYILNVKQNHWKPFNGTLWQRNYYEHIIRNETSFHKIRQYIINNPTTWATDQLNPQCPAMLGNENAVIENPVE
jgi:REP element-mobilizing transposase RayT